MTVRKASFPPVVDAGVRLLVLGSLPGEASLAATQYYAHPRNNFWRLMQTVTGQPLEAAAYDERLALLLRAHVGLWDVIATAERIGSLDTAIRNAAANGLKDLVASLPDLRAVAFNGATASAIGRKELGQPDGFALIDLPSSSPAHARVPFEAKLAAWLALQAFLAP